MKMKKRQSNSSIVFKVLRQVSIRGLWIGWKTASLPHVANDYAYRSNSIKVPCEMAWRLRNIRFNLYDNRISDCRHSSDEGFIWPPSVLADWYWYGNKCRRRYGKWRIIIIGCRFGGTLFVELSCTIYFSLSIIIIDKRGKICYNKDTLKQLGEHDGSSNYQEN